MVALKSLKIRYLSKDERQRLFSEVDICLLMDHPHIARLFEVYQEEFTTTLCMELLTGGELFERLVRVKRYDERHAARLVKQMCSAVAYMHSPSSPGGQICHRDLKLENFMFSDDTDDAQLKLIDFGLSKVTEQGVDMTLWAGTIHYMAPEVLKCKYDHRCDLWSLGVVVYMILFGRPPFSMKRVADTHSKIRKGKYKLWRSVSGEAQDFLKCLLHVNPVDRTSAADLIGHPWIKANEVKLDEPAPAIDADLLQAMQQYAAQSAFKRAALELVSLSVPVAELDGLRATFEQIDTGRQGVITVQEFHQCISKCGGGEEMKASAEALFAKLDLSDTHAIHYSEFLASCIQWKFHDDQLRQHLHDVFRKFDVDSKGAITVDNLRGILGNEFGNAKVEDLLAECDANHDGGIDFDEFVSYLAGCVVVDAVAKDKDDGLCGVGTVDSDDGSPPPTPTPTALDQSTGPGGLRARQADAFKVMSVLVNAAEDMSLRPASQGGGSGVALDISVLPAASALSSARESGPSAQPWPASGSTVSPQVSALDPGPVGGAAD